MTFPLIPQGRLIGLSFGTMRSFRRGSGSDVIGSRAYRPGDDVHAIDWAASARQSSARAADEFVVRERYAEEAPRVVIVCDRRPSMSFHAPPLPWLDKRAAAAAAADLVFRSAVAVGGFVGYLDHAEGETHWEPPRGGRKLRELVADRLASDSFDAPDDAIPRALEHLAEHPWSVPSGAFVFVLSDFLPPPSERCWRRALEHRWDLVPVVIQDPTWEQSFPDVGGIVVPLRDARTARAAPVLLRAREARERREANEDRTELLLGDFRRLGLDPVVIGSTDPVEILTPFVEWAEARRWRRRAAG